MSEKTPLPTTERLLELIAGMNGQPVLMLVDLVADRFISGKPKRISREAPVLILEFQEETLTPGGGANAIANIAALGGEPLPLGVVGRDDSGDRLLERLGRSDVTTRGIIQREGYRTPTKTRILGGGIHSIKQQIVRYDTEETLELDEADRQHFRTALADWSGRARIAVLSDYGYGTVDPSLVPLLADTLASPSVLLGDSRYRLQAYRGLDGATPNEEEAEKLLAAATGQPLGDLLDSGRGLLEQLGLGFLLVTRGSYGMALFTSDAAYRIPVHGTDQVADVTGAGDTVIGTFALALAAGADAVEAALLANYAGGIVVLKAGTATLSRAELERAVASNPLPIQETRWERY